MKFSVRKKDFHGAASLATKLVGKYSHVNLLAKGDALWLIINSDFYVKLRVPGVTVESEGLIAIQQEIFSQIFSMRGETFKAEYDDKQNKLYVVCGSKNSIYVNSVSKEDIKVPELEADSSLALPSKAVGEFRKMLQLAKYISPDPDSHGYAIAVNNKEGFAIKFGSTNSCAFYQKTEPITKKPFELTIPVSSFADVFGHCSAEIEMSFSESMIMVKSDTIIATFPTLQDDTKAKIDNATVFVNDNSLYEKGEVVFSPNSLLEVLTSIRVVSGGADTVGFKCKGDKAILSIESKYGKGKDTFKLKSNTIGEFEIEVSELFLDSTIEMCRGVAKEVSMKLPTSRNFYKLNASSDYCSFTTLGPVMS